MTRVRWARRVLSFTCAAVLLAACGDGGVDGGNTAATDEPSTATDDAADDGDDSADEAAAGGEAATVTWWGWTPATENAQQYIDAFNELHPDITIDYRFFQFPDYSEALRTGLVGDAGPDVFNLQAGEITDRFGQFALDLTERLTTSIGDGWEQDFAGDVEERFKRDGAALGVPMQVSATGQFWYNKTILDQYGLEPPATRDELADVCARLEAEGVQCLAHGAQDGWPTRDLFMGIAQDLEPGAFYEAWEGNRSWTDPVFVQTFEEIAALWDDGIVPDDALGVAQYPDANNAWVTGEAAFIVLGAWNAGSMRLEGLHGSQEAAGAGTEDFVMLPMRFPDFNGDGSRPQLWGDADYALAINGASEVQDAAWTFVEWMTSVDGGQAITAELLFVPARIGLELPTDGLADPSVQEAGLQQMLDDMADLGGYAGLGLQELVNTHFDVLAGVASGTLTPEQAAEQMQSASESIER
jgi:raffinose/stachyose/melibiose transport system substrate-binding protein